MVSFLFVQKLRIKEELVICRIQLISFTKTQAEDKGGEAF
jgi:hypothetical protein